MTLIRRLRSNIRLLQAQKATIRMQQELILDLARTCGHSLRLQELEHLRTVQGMAAAWLISIEMPEKDIRDDLVTMERSLCFQIAALEEHILD